MTRQFLVNSDIKILQGCSDSGASKIMAFLRAYLGKKRLTITINGKEVTRYQPITISEYCQANDLDEKSVRETLKID